MPYCPTDFDNFLKDIFQSKENMLFKKKKGGGDFIVTNRSLKCAFWPFRLIQNQETANRERCYCCCDSSAYDQAHASTWFCARMSMSVHVFACHLGDKGVCLSKSKYYSKYGLNQLKHVGCMHGDTEAALKHPPTHTCGLIMNYCPKSDVCHQHLSSPGCGGTWQHCCNLVMSHYWSYSARYATA